jgi:hypothetical protein
MTTDLDAIALGGYLIEKIHQYPSAPDRWADSEFTGVLD